jgi:hypothetical protein
LSRRPAILARPSEHDQDHEGRDARVEEHVADRDHGADRRRDPDHVAERRQRVARAHEVVFRRARADETLGAGTRGFEGTGAYGHPAVHTDHDDVQHQSGDHEP